MGKSDDGQHPTMKGGESRCEVKGDLRQCPKHNFSYMLTLLIEVTFPNQLNILK